MLVLSAQVRRAAALEGDGGRALVPDGHRLDAGEDFPLVAGQGHAHVQQIPETKQTPKMLVVRQEQWIGEKSQIKVLLGMFNSSLSFECECGENAACALITL